MDGTLTADGTVTAQAWYGGKGYLVGRGTFGGGTLLLQGCENNSGTDGDWVTAATPQGAIQLTAGGIIPFALPAGSFVRAKLTGSTSPALGYAIRPQ